MAVRDMASQPSVEHSGSRACGPEPEPFRVQDLVHEIELDHVLQDPEDYDSEATEQVWKRTVDEITFHTAWSTLVMVQKCSPQLGS